MNYLGCQKQNGACDLCGAEQEYLHSLTDGAKLCEGCAEEKITPRSQRGIAAIAEAWSRRDGGKWVSRWHVEEAYQ